MLRMTGAAVVINKTNLEKRTKIPYNKRVDVKKESKHVKSKS